MLWISASYYIPHMFSLSCCCCCIDLSSQELHGVARLKVADLLSIKLMPRPLLKLGGAWSLPGTGMALRLKYEVPLAHLGEFWTPPARVMVR
jgi:predicted benzoate:H+ symporter BenE